MVRYTRLRYVAQSPGGSSTQIIHQVALYIDLPSDTEQTSTEYGGSNR